MKNTFYTLLTLCFFLTCQTVHAQDEYVTPRQIPVLQGKAPGLKYKLLSDHNGEKTYALIFTKGDDVLSGLTDFAVQNHVTCARITGIGAISSAKMGCYDRTKQKYHLIPITTQSEIVSMLGDIAVYNDKPVVHVHTTVGLSDGHVLGGHLFEAIVWPTLEVMLTVEPTTLIKKRDEETDLLLINP